MEDHPLLIEVMAECDHPLTITTKGALIERDLDLLAPMAAKGLVRVFVSIAMLDRELARKLDPRAAAPHRRLQIVKALSGAGIPVGVNVAPIIPQLTDHELEAILEAAAAAGARYAFWTMLRLPLEVAPLFRDWLAAHYPLRAAHVMSIVRQIRGGKDYESQFKRAHGRSRRVRRSRPQALRARLQATRPQYRSRRAARQVALPAAAQQSAARPFLVAVARACRAADKRRNIPSHGPAEAGATPATFGEQA